MQIRCQRPSFASAWRCLAWSARVSCCSGTATSLSPIRYVFDAWLLVNLPRAHSCGCALDQTSLEFYENFSRTNEPWLSDALSFFYPPAASLNSQSHSNANSHAYNRNPFDEGWRKNVRRVLGEVPWYRLLWPSRHLPPPPKYPFDLDGRDLQDVIHNV